MGVPPKTFKLLDDLRAALAAKKGKLSLTSSWFYHIYKDHPAPRWCGPDPPGDPRPVHCVRCTRLYVVSPPARLAARRPRARRMRVA